MPPTLRADTGAVYPIPIVGVNTIGSGTSVILLTTPGVKPDHAVIQRMSGDKLIIKPGTGEVYVNGARISSQKSLNDGDVILLGRLRLTIVNPLPTSRTPAPIVPKPSPPVSSPLAPPRPAAPKPVPFGGSSPTPSHMPSAPSPISPYVPPASPTPFAASSPMPMPGSYIFPAQVDGKTPVLQGEVVNVTQRQEQKRSPIVLSVFWAILALCLSPIIGFSGAILMLNTRSRPLVSVHLMRVRDASRPREVAVRADGDPAIGFIDMGDQVSFFGSQKGGVVIMSSAYNHTTASTVTLRRNVGEIVAKWLVWGMIALAILLCISTLHFR